MYKMDFHIHTSSSDGLLSPIEVVKRAKENSVSYLAITDHDTLSGLDAGIKCGKELGVTIIPGIELSTQYNNLVNCILLITNYESKYYSSLIN